MIHAYSAVAVFAVFVAAPAAAPAVAQETAPPRCAYGAPHENAPEELSQFAFLIGDYTIARHIWQGDEWSLQPDKAARWNGWYGLGGMAIFDEWYESDPAQDPDAPRGINVRIYDEEAGEWVMMWVATDDFQVLDLRAKMKDDGLWMWHVYPERPDSKHEFVVEDADHWTRISYAKNDAGEWEKQFKLVATRMPCDADEG